MEVKLVSAKEGWNKFVAENKGSFLQAFEWGELEKRDQVWRWEVVSSSQKILAAQVVKEKINIFTYFYLPYGPVFNLAALAEEKREAFSLLLKEIRSLARKEGATFLRVEPFVQILNIGKEFRVVASPKRIQPQRTIVLGLGKTEEEILKDLHIRTRYNLNLAKRKGVRIKISDEYSPVFYDLLAKTKDRQGFIPHSEAHYQKIFNLNNEDFKVKMFLAEYQNNSVVASILIFFGDCVTALHAGSDYNFRAIKGAELMHWQAFLLGKSLGYKLYDFWGIDDKKFPGVSNFKRGFAGNEIEYPAGIDIIFNSTQYQIYKLMRKIKQLF